MLGLCEKPCATSRALYRTISLYSFHFVTKTHVYQISTTHLGVWTTGLNASCFASEFSSAWIASFHIGQSFLCQRSLTICGSISSSLLVMPKAILNANISFITILSQSKISLVWIYIIYISLFPDTYISLRDASLGGSILGDDFDTIFITCFMNEES